MIENITREGYYLAHIADTLS